LAPGVKARIRTPALGVMNRGFYQCAIAVEEIVMLVVIGLITDLVWVRF
jgi:hypothetical protein